MNRIFIILDKDTWIGKERLRWASYFSVPMIEGTPEGFPPATLGAQRALCVISQKFPDKLVPAVESLYSAFWLDGNSKIGSPETFVPILERVLGKKETGEILTAVSAIDDGLEVVPEVSY